ncbi:hypothetical protein BDC45DRAFT_561343 [Circinella umbellata]|nr:hypothetical protein BDC45DRAFT_561343 [Circinella umbellata]
MAHKLLLPLIFILFSVLPYHYIYSYWILSEIVDGTTLNIYQEDGQGSWHKSERTRFHVENLGPRDRVYCRDRSFRCNQDRKNPDHLVTLVVSYSKDGFKTIGGTHKIILPAKGFLTTQGTYENFTYEVLDAHARLFSQPT